jgi:hypothetical protein
MDDGVQVGPRRDGGQAVVLMAVVVAFVALVAVGTARAGAVVLDRQRAQTAADAAALAGLHGGKAAAAALATSNGATLESFVVVGDEVSVEVRYGHAQARARASDGP